MMLCRSGKFLRVILCAVCAAGIAFGETEDNAATHEPGKTEETTASSPKTPAASTPGTSTSELPPLTRQEALVKGLKETGMATFPLEKLSELVANNPQATPKQFNELVDLAADAMPGAITDEQKKRVKKLYADELGAVKRKPGSEFAQAAKLLVAAQGKNSPAVKKGAAADPQGKQAKQDTAKEGTPKDTAAQLAGANVIKDGKSQEALLQELVDKASKAQGAELTKGLQAQLAQAQTLLQGIQKAQGQDKSATFGKLGGKGLLDELIADLKKGDKEEKGGGRDRRDGGGRDRDQHGPQNNNSSDDNGGGNKDDNSKFRDLAKKSFEEKDKKNGQPQANNNNNNNGDKNSGNEKKEETKKEETSAPSSSSSFKKSKKKEDDAPSSDSAKSDLSKLLGADSSKDEPEDALTAAKGLANGGKIFPLEPKGQGKAGQAIKDKGDGGFGGGGGGGDGGGEGGGKGGGGAIKGGGGGGGSGFEGNPFQGLGESMDSFGGGGPFSFQKTVEFGSAGGGAPSTSGGDETVDGGGDETPDPRLKAKAAAMNGQVMVLSTGPEKIGSVMDYVGRWRKGACELEDAKNIGVCQLIAARKKSKELARRISAGKSSWTSPLKEKGDGSAVPPFER